MYKSTETRPTRQREKQATLLHQLSTRYILQLRNCCSSSKYWSKRIRFKKARDIYPAAV